MIMEDRREGDPAENEETILIYKSHLQRKFADIYIGRNGLVKFCEIYSKLADVNNSDVVV